MTALQDHPFLLACRRQRAPRTPVWLMRQAGRYLPEYRRVRDRVSFLELCTRPELAAEVTVDAVRRLGVDAAIVFADILLPLIPMGFALDYESGSGPRITPQLRDAAQTERLRSDRAHELAFVGETIRLVCAAEPQTPVIGFAGAPFTLASYAIEGGVSTSFLETKRFMHREPQAWRRFMEAIVAVTSEYLRLQIAGGAHALQLFDSWAGALSPDDYERYAFPYARDVIAAIGGAVPVIYFSTMSGGLLESIRTIGADVVSVDWRVRLDRAWSQLGSNVGIQGNLDPATLLGSMDDVRKAVGSILQSVAGRPGHVFNLGHGVLPQTPVDNVLALVDAVRQFRAT
jgi:uroporphyrinogen decarboxylase